MIKIISTVPHPSVVKEVICKNCGATLEYAPVDVAVKIDYDYTGGSDSIRYIKCPNCDNHITQV